MKRLALIFVGLFCASAAVMMAMEHNNPNIQTEAILAEAFYYSAIGLAVYHLYNKSRQNRAQ